MLRALVPVLALALVLASAGLAAADGPAEERARERGAEVVASFEQAMRAALQQALARGPVEAIAVCRERAPEIARRLSREGVRVGRTSHRLRNPANAPPAWVEPLLASYVAEPQQEPQVVPLDAGGHGYVQPIFTAPPCLTCHGASVPPPVAERIRALYPEDRATGFGAGELRGLFWVELPEPADEPGPPR
ncbi:MAG: DUF3365 domain-containing protein [Myxococcota bacterium]|nr:DUF3365 domain-containing protein [Myxococcota bacterium]